MLKDDTLLTHPAGPNILSGITRDLVLTSAQACHFNVQETLFSLADIYRADGLWISSSTREIMPITILNGESINQGVIHSAWECVYDHYQQLKND
jgi:D-alanine transaminase